MTTKKFSLQRSQIDRNISLLIEQLYSAEGRYLIVADENWILVNWRDIAATCKSNLSLISNRYDIVQQAQGAGLVSIFNDFDFNDFEPKAYDGILFRVSKERASSHHVINEASRLLKPQGLLLLSGEKNDGLKTYVKKTCDLFGDRTAAKKHGNNYLARVRLHRSDSALLDHNSYDVIRPVKALSNLSFSSKPGIFGWDKIDRGSAFLVEHLPIFLSRFDRPPKSLLDLGCGYGYLSFYANQNGINKVTATDNNAAAILAAKANLKPIIKECEVIPSDAGDTVEGNFDTIWCNPPFHQGFAIDEDMSAKFLKATKRLLAPEGHALFVVNTFIPLEKKALKYFRSVQALANNGSFKLIALRN